MDPLKSRPKRIPRPLICAVIATAVLVPASLLAQERKPPTILRGHKDFVRTLAFSLDGKLLASGSFDKTVKFWDVGSGKSVGAVQMPDGQVTSVAFGPNGKTLASATNAGTIYLWEVASGKTVSDREIDCVLGTPLAPN